MNAKKTDLSSSHSFLKCKRLLPLVSLRIQFAVESENVGLLSFEQI